MRFGGFDMILCGDINETRAAAAAHIVRHDR
jgi:hypothetical protein